MTCPKCGSTNVLTQQQSDLKMKNKHHSILWWIPFGLIWTIFKWVFLTLPALLAKIFIPKRQKIVQKTYMLSICQNCGYQWRP